MLDGNIPNDDLQPPSAGTRRPPKPVKHQWFDQWLIARGEPLKALVAEIEQIIDSREQRQRARKVEVRAYHRRMVEGIVCNLAYATLKPPLPTGRLAVNIRNEAKGKTRYDNRAFGKPYRRALDVLEREGILNFRLPDAIRREVSSIAPTQAVADRVRTSGVSFADFAADQNQEVIRLTRVTRTYSIDRHEPYRHKELTDYIDDAVTNRYRAAVRALNAFLHDADIAFVDDGLEPRIDANRRTLTRRFTVFDADEDRFDQVGRLFGGFWMAMKRERRSGIRINGEPVVDLDFSSMFTRLAYADLQRPPPSGDLYAIPGLEDYRDGVKLAMNCSLFDEHQRRLWPSDMNHTYEIDAEPTDDYDADAAKLPPGWTVSKTKTAILSVHPDLEAAWGRSLGYRLMWQESEILMAVLTDLMEQDIPALGLHDGLLVPVSKTEIALQAMRSASKAVVGVELPCKVKGS